MSGSQIGVPTSPGPFEWPQNVQTRLQGSISKLQQTFPQKLLKLEAFFEWTPDEWTHCPWPLRVARRRPEEASRDDPDHLRMQKSVFSKMLVFLKEIKVFEVRVAKLPSEHPPFVALGPPPRAIWTDVKSCYPWERHTCMRQLM